MRHPTYIGGMTQNRNTQTLRIASYNIRKARGLDRRYDPHRTLDVINSLNADVVALQEADHRLGDRPAALPRSLIETQSDYRVVPLARSDDGIGWHGNAMLVRSGVSPVALARLDLPGREPRGAVRIDLAVGDGLTIVGAHLGLMRRHRRAQLTNIVGRTEDSQNTVIIGDFNEWSHRRGLEALANGYAIHAPGRSFHAARPTLHLDRIATSGSFEVTATGISRTRRARLASDHLPIWIDIAFESD